MHIKKVYCMGLKKVKLFAFCIKIFVYLYQQNKTLIKLKQMQKTSERLETTLANIEHQKGSVHWDDFEKLEDVLKAIKELEKENETLKSRIINVKKIIN